MTNWFDVGLYDNGLVSSKSDFFMIDVTNESLKEAGTQTVASERLNRYVTNDVSKSDTPMSTETGNGSAADDLSGSRAMAAATLSDNSDANSVNATPGGAGGIVGGAGAWSTWFVPPFRRKSLIDHRRRRHHRHDVLHVPAVGRQ